MTNLESPSTDVFALIEKILFWIKKLFTKKPAETIAICGAPIINNDRSKSAADFFKKHDLINDITTDSTK